MTTHSSILAGEISQTEKPGRPHIVHRVTNKWATEHPRRHTLYAYNELPSWSEVKVAQSCPTLCDPMEHIVHGILQGRILEWVAFPFSRGSSQPRDWTQVSHIAGGVFTSWATREAQEHCSGQPVPSQGDLPDPKIEPESPALQADSLPTELSGKPYNLEEWFIKTTTTAVIKGSSYSFNLQI